jgi:predicted metal-dependent phosphoesterase TrpH
VIDLHTHTNASDGRLSPGDLVDRAAAAHVTVLAVTDHDTVAGCAAARAACLARQIAFVDGIEVTAVADGSDVHVLGYFVDTESASFLAFLSEQRRFRSERVRAIVHQLASQGIMLDADGILAPGVADSGRSPGRPWVARALVAAGYVATADEAFSKWLERGRPGFVPRTGASPAQVFDRIHEARGVASLAHPVLVGHDEWIPAFAAAGLDALEAYHSKHDAWTTKRYRAMARELGLAVSGGSDYHADASHGPAGPGSVSLPREEFDRLARLKADRGY